MCASVEKYPQIKKLFGYDPNFKWVVSLMVAIQFCMLFVMKDRSWPTTILVAYCFGGVINHSLMLGEKWNKALVCTLDKVQSGC